jgi:hypothetical protein
MRGALMRFEMDACCVNGGAGFGPAPPFAFLAIGEAVRNLLASFCPAVPRA